MSKRGDFLQREARLEQNRRNCRHQRPHDGLLQCRRKIIQAKVSLNNRLVFFGSIHPQITAEIEQLLDSYKAEYESSLGYSGPRVWLWLGNIIIALGLVAVLYFSIYFTNYRIYDNPNTYTYLLVIFLLSSATAFSSSPAAFIADAMESIVSVKAE